MSDLHDLADAFSRAADMLPQALIDAEADTLEEAKQIAVELSSGPYTTRQLRKMKHPYAKRDPRPPQDDAIINEQTGTFKEAWQINAPVQVGDEIVSSLVNDSDHARELNDGTDTMIARHTVQRILEKIEPKRQQRLHDAFDSVMPGGDKNPL